jgi:hypothetical protein
MHVISRHWKGKVIFILFFFTSVSVLSHNAFKEVVKKKWPLLLFFFEVLGFELRAYTLSHSISPFLWWDFWDRVWQTIYSGWLWTVILLISASWVASTILLFLSFRRQEWDGILAGQLLYPSWNKNQWQRRLCPVLHNFPRLWFPVSQRLSWTPTLQSVQYPLALARALSTCPDSISSCLAL